MPSFKHIMIIINRGPHFIDNKIQTRPILIRMFAFFFIIQEELQIVLVTISDFPLHLSFTREYLAFSLSLYIYIY